MKMADEANDIPEADRDDGKLYEFTVDAALLKELGERLVGKPYVALAELVKNSYDADATKVRITFQEDAIEVVDNGDGMSRAEFKNFWMRVGTTHKQASPITARFKRKVSGSKGIGRLSVQFLGNFLKLWSVSLNAPNDVFRAEVDWRQAQRAASLIKSGAKVYAPVPIQEALPDDFAHGTKIRIEGLNQSWEDESLRDFAREFWFLRPPPPLAQDLEEKDTFDIELAGPAEAARAAFDTQLEKAFQGWIAEIRGEVSNGRRGRPATVTVSFKDGESKTQSFNLSRSGLDRATFRIRVYKLAGKQAGGIPVSDAREYFQRFGGVHIYDQAFRLPFYGAEGEDWLRLEYDHSHRRMLSKLVPENLKGEGDLRDLPTNGRIFGTVHISTGHEGAAAGPSARAKGEYLNIQITRDRLIDNAAFADLREMVRWGLDYYSYLASARKHKASRLKGLSEPIKPTEPIFDEIRQHISDLRADVPPQALMRLTGIGDRVEELHDIQQKRVERFDRERVLLGALATAGMGAIALEHELGKELTALNRAIEGLARIPASPAVTKVKGSLSSLVIRITDARKLLSPLMEPENRDHIARMKARQLVEVIVSDLKPLLRSITVETDDIDENLRLPPATRAAWTAILQNVIVNSINATIDTSSKRIRVVGAYDSRRKQGFLRIEDNGVGVDLDDAETLFEPFERRLELSPERKRLGLGGVGLGLTIVRMVAHSVGCKINFVEPSRNMSTAFELTWEADEELAPASNTHRRRRA
jgi:signal transduction histidine kinase